VIQVPLLSPGFYTVFLEERRINLRIGVLPEEATPQPVTISIAMIVKRLTAEDGIEAVVDYHHMYEAIDAALEEAPFGLQETLCERLISNIRPRDGVFGVIVESRKTALYTDAASVGCRMLDIAPEALAS